MRMLPCCHRLVPEKESRCWLQSSRRDEEGPALVFSSPEGGPVLCGPALASRCPFRSWTESEVRPGMADCPHCGKRHRNGSNSQMLCEAWSSVKGVLKDMRRELPEGRRFYLEGTTVLPYDQHTTPLVRRLVWQRLKYAVLRRDRYRCQDCGSDFGARRRKVFDPQMRRGKGGYRWESLEVHHIIARSNGGSDHPGNLKTLCPACHRTYTSDQAVERTAEGRKRREELRALHEEGFADDLIDDPRD